MFILFFFGLCSLQLFCPPLTTFEGQETIGFRSLSEELATCRPTELFSAHIEENNFLFIIEARGRIIAFNEEEEEQETFFDFEEQVLSEEEEQGLLGATFHPGFPQEDSLYLYIHYTALSGDSVISRFDVEIDRGEAEVVEGSELEIFRLSQPEELIHTGGTIQFGPDGYLYILFGDGGVPEESQDTESPFGKVLRIDVNDANPTTPFTIPPTNPFSNSSNPVEQMVFAFGVRNPIRWSFDGEILWLGDVGADRWEEVDALDTTLDGGRNLGWNLVEGIECFQTQDTEGCNQTGLQSPVLFYPHPEIEQEIAPAFSFSGEGIVGGYVYRGSQIPQLFGHYVFADREEGVIYTATFGANLADGPTSCHTIYNFESPISGFGVDPDQELYVTFENAGEVLMFYNFETEIEAEEEGFPELGDNRNSFLCAGEMGTLVRFTVGFALGMAIIICPALLACYGYFVHYNELMKIARSRKNEVDLDEIQPHSKTATTATDHTEEDSE